MAVPGGAVLLVSAYIVYCAGLLGKYYHLCGVDVFEFHYLDVEGQGHIDEVGVVLAHIRVQDNLVNVSSDGGLAQILIGQHQIEYVHGVRSLMLAISGARQPSGSSSSMSGVNRNTSQPLAAAALSFSQSLR